MHKLLERQVRRQFGAVENAPPELAPLLAAIDASYVAADEDRALLERSLEISSQEMGQKNAELRDAYRRLQEQDAFRAQFINNAAHELGTPLTPMRLEVTLLRKRGWETLTPSQRRSVEILGRNLDRLGALVGDMLVAARSQAGRLTLTLRPVDMQALVLDAVEAHRALAAQAGLSIETLLPGQTPMLADAKRLTQVLDNLLSNAIKFTPSGGALRVELDRDEKEARILVRDTGPGLAAEDVPKLFHPFSQLQPGLGRGSGLGLYICRSLVELHGGRIWAESEGPGKGASFRIALPREGPEVEA